jgi:hypothetical protein
MPIPTDQRPLLAFFAQSFAEDISLLGGLPLSNVTLSADEPLPINDLNGEPLFLDFRIVDNSEQQIGVIRSSGRGEQLPLIDSISLGQQYFDPSTAVSTAINQSRNDLPGSSVQSASFVCYGYPHIGVLLNCTVNQQPWSLIYDAAGGILVRKTQGSAVQPGSESGPMGQSIDGLPCYSYLDRLRGLDAEGDATDSMRATTTSVAATNQWQGVRAAFSRLARADSARPGAMMPMDEAPTTPANTRVGIRGTILPARLFGQQTQVYCAVATVQMILDFLGLPNFTQSQIAQALQTSDVGTTNPNMITGISQLTQGKWIAKVISLPTFQQNISLVEALIPCKSGIPGHARLLRGWREYCFINGSGNVVHKEQFYVINDPYPMGTGQLVLESAVTPIANFYTNSLYVLSATNAGSASIAGIPESGVGADIQLEGSPVFGRPQSSSPTRVINSRTFEITLPPLIRVSPGDPIRPEVLEFLAAMLRTKVAGGRTA